MHFVSFFYLIYSKFELMTSQGSAATYLMCGKNITPFVADFIRFLAVKSFESRLRFDKVILDNTRDVSETQCTFISYCQVS